MWPNGDGITKELSAPGETGFIKPGTVGPVGITRPICIGGGSGD